MEDLNSTRINAADHTRLRKGHHGNIIHEVLDDLQCSEHQADCTQMLPGLFNMDCFQEACVLVKDPDMVFRVKDPIHQDQGPVSDASPVTGGERR